MQLRAHTLTAHAARSAGPPPVSRLPGRAHPAVAAPSLLDNYDDGQTDHGGDGADDESEPYESGQLSALARPIL